MASSTPRRRENESITEEQMEHVRQDGNDSCPLLGEEESPATTDVRCHQIRDVRRIDNGALGCTKRSLAQRIRSRKNRFVQHVLVACHLIDPSRDLMFKQELSSNKVAIEKLTTIRNSVFAYSESIVSLSTAICCFTGNSARLQDGSQDALANVVVEGSNILECSLVFSDQVEKSVLAKIDHRIAELERVRSLITERAKLVVDVEYAERVLALEQQRGHVNRIAERKHALQVARLECEKATRIILEQLKFVHPNQDTDVFGLLQESVQLVAQFFRRGVDLVNSAVPCH
uniref:Uncharacterized protein n=1 Tax=Peronospora matthiolae TaxID=2874970 RepID=A0AAV1T225_9STRA